jgi:uncharacterized protein YutE (UPF0331/DUF86 family)
VKSKSDILVAIDVLITQGTALPVFGGFLRREVSADGQYWLSKVVAILGSFLPASSFHFTEAVRLAERSHRQGGIIQVDVDALIGHLRFLRDAVDQDLLRTLEHEVSAADFASFLGHARHYLADGKKVEASVIAAAIFEDTVKQLGQAYAVADLSKLDATISALKAKNVISAVEAKQLRYLAGIRNAALHASWDEFDLPAVGDLIEGVERLLTMLSEAP